MESTLLKGFSPVVKSTSIINEMVMLAFFAGRFAAKESISKSLKTGIGKFSFTDIEILNDNAGAPVVYLCGELREDIQVSISHSQTHAMAVSMIVR